MNSDVIKVKRVPNSPEKYTVTGQTNGMIPSSTSLLSQPDLIVSPPDRSLESAGIANLVTYQIPNLNLVYSGSIFNNRFHGQGILARPNSRPGEYIYKGQWLEGARTGYGHYLYPDGSEYKGEWLNNMKEGQGTYTSPRGDRYEGRWSKGMRHGDGRLALRDGTQIEGSWQNDIFQEGKIGYSNSSRYEGRAPSYIRSGQGTFTYQDGSKYVGQWHNNNRHGRGQYRFPNGDTYNGGFKQGVKHGQGCQYRWAGGAELTGATFTDGRYEKDSGFVNQARNNDRRQG